MIRHDGSRCATMLLALTVLLAAMSGTLAAAPVSKTATRGPVQATVTLSTDQLTIGDTVELRLEVQAAAGVELLLPEFGQSLERHAVVDFAPGEHLDEAGQLVRTQRYVLRPEYSGRHAVPPLMIEFIDRRPGKRAAPEGEDAYELLTETLRFTVASVLPQETDDNLHPALGDLAPIERPIAETTGGLVAIMLLITGAGMLAWWWARRPRGRAADPAELAFHRLAALRASGTPDASAMGAFFVTLTDIVRRYVEQRFGLHAPELTTEEFLDSLTRSPDLGPEHQRFLRDFLSSADRVKFARHIPSAESAVALLEAATGFVSETSAVPKPDSARVDRHRTGEAGPRPAPADARPTHDGGPAHG